MKYYDTFYGIKVSDYALKYGYLDYRTFAKCFDCVLCNRITEFEEYLYDNIICGDIEEYYYQGEEITKEDAEKLEEEGKEIERNFVDIFQFYIVSDNALELLKEAEEIVKPCKMTGKQWGDRLAKLEQYERKAREIQREQWQKARAWGMLDACELLDSPRTTKAR